MRGISLMTKIPQLEKIILGIVWWTNQEDKLSSMRYMRDYRKTWVTANDLVPAAAARCGGDVITEAACPTWSCTGRSVRIAIGHCSTSVAVSESKHGK